MAKQYFACDWVVSYLAKFAMLDELYPIAHALDCRLVLIHPFHDQVNADGCRLLCYALEVPSEKRLYDFIQNIRQLVDLGEWVATSQAYFLTGIELKLLERNVYVFSNPDYLTTLRGYALFNELIIDKNSQQHHPNKFYSAIWVIDAETITKFVELVDWCNERGVTVFYEGQETLDQINGFELIGLRFLFRIPYDAVSDVLKIGETYQLTHWQELGKSDFYNIPSGLFHRIKLSNLGASWVEWISESITLTHRLIINRKYFALKTEH